MEIFLCANTPGYLYTHLRQAKEVEVLAEQSSTDGLYAIGRHALEGEQKNLERELSFYIAVIALSLKPYSEISIYLTRLKTDKYKWANSIISLVKTKYRLVTVEAIDIIYEPKIVIAGEDVKDVAQTTQFAAEVNAPALVNSPETGVSDSTGSAISVDLQESGGKNND